jgi:BMFP domain-containing protein YqiC
MLEHQYFDELDGWIPEVIAASLAWDVETNLKALISARSGGNLNPATRDDYDLQVQVLQRICDKLDALAVRLARPAQEAGAGATPDPGGRLNSTA